MIATLPTTQFLQRPADRAAWSDETLVEACLARDETAWNELIHRYGRLIYSIPRTMGLSAERAEDIAQSVFLAIHRHLAGLRDRSRLSAWIISMTRRQCYRAIRAARQARVESADSIDATDERLAPAGTRLDQLEKQQLVRIALRRLGGPGERLLSALFTQTGERSYEQIARDLGMKVGSIGPTRARAFAKLRAILHEMGVTAADLFDHAEPSADAPDAIAA